MPPRAGCEGGDRGGEAGADRLSWRVNLKAAGIGGFDSGGLADNIQYWASSQQTADMAAHIDFADLGRLHGDDKDFPRRVRAIRMI